MNIIEYRICSKIYRVDQIETRSNFKEIKLIISLIDNKFIKFVEVIKKNNP